MLDDVILSTFGSWLIFLTASTLAVGFFRSFIGSCLISIDGTCIVVYKSFFFWIILLYNAVSNGLFSVVWVESECPAYANGFCCVWLTRWEFD